MASYCAARISNSLIRPVTTGSLGLGNGLTEIGKLRSPLVFISASNYSTLPDGTFKYSDIEVSLAGPSQLKPKPDISSLVFGKYYSDYMFEADWEATKGWSKPRILPLHDLKLHPGSKVLHYSVELFEGMKAYRGVDGKVRLFRPELNMQRILRGARRSLLPEFEPEQFLACIKRLVKLEQEWIPHSESASLYIRPTFIGTDPSLGVARSQTALLFVVLCPVGPYFATGFKPVSLLADPQYVRAWPGGSGDTKFGSNYGPTIYIQKKAEEAGFQQVLWLFGEDHQLTEVGTMNIFAFMSNQKGEKELITPPLNGLILPGVTRQSILDLTREWKDIKVIERTITMAEIIKANEEQRLMEVFGAGTACVVCPVSSIFYKGVSHKIPTVEQKSPIHMKILKNLNDIYYGRVAHPWGVLV